MHRAILDLIAATERSERGFTDVPLAAPPHSIRDRPGMNCRFCFGHPQKQTQEASKHRTMRPHVQSACTCKLFVGH